MDADDVVARPAAFPSRPGELFPVYHVLKEIGEFAGGTVRQMGKDNQTIAMGGLIREDTRDVNTRVPILGRIPVLGEGVDRLPVLIERWADDEAASSELERGAVLTSLHKLAAVGFGAAATAMLPSEAGNGPLRDERTRNGEGACQHRTAAHKRGRRRLPPTSL